MVAVLLRLKLTLLARNFRRNGWAAFGMVAAYLFAGLMILPLLVLFFLLRSAPVVAVDAVTVPLFGMMTLGWLLLPILFFGVDETLDPGRFALLPVPARKLVPGLILTSFIGAPGIALILLSLGLIVAWSGSAATFAAAVVAAPLGCLTCVLLSRALTTALAGMLSTRRAKENAVAIVAFSGIFLSIGFQAGSVWISGVMARAEAQSSDLGLGAGVVGWTPFGWAWAVPGDIAEGRYGLAAVHLALGSALIAGLTAWWRRGLESRLVMPPSGVGTAQAVRSGSWLERIFGVSPRGAVATRIMRSCARDSRLKMQLVMTAILPLFILLPPLAAGQRQSTGPSTGALSFLGVFLAAMVGTAIAQSLVTDGTAASLHALVGLRGRDDRWGRVWAYLLIYAPLLVIFTVISLVMLGEWGTGLATVGLTLALLLCGAGAASWAGALFQWPMPPQEGGPFQQQSGGGANALILMIVVMLATTVGALPAVVLCFMAFDGVSWAGPAGLVAGAACGAAALWWGCWVGGDVLDRRWPEALTAMREK